MTEQETKLRASILEMWAKEDARDQAMVPYEAAYQQAVAAYDVAYQEALDAGLDAHEIHHALVHE
jgi:hypothetical protein